MRPGIFFLPFLFIYCTIILLFQKTDLTVDEPSYLTFASNLIHGYYSPPPPDIDLWHAPGYPLTLAPWVAINTPVTILRLFNAVWLYLSLLIFYRLLTRMVKLQTAIAGTCLLGMYWLAWKGLPVLMTETFVFFLITAMLYLAHGYFERERNDGKQLLLLGSLIGYLCLTKFLFAYSVIALLFLSGLQWLRGKMLYKKAFKVCVLAFLFTLPWLIYTYSLTGRIFYWSNSGGANLYWMSNPVAGEWGDWFSESLEPNGSVDGTVPDAAQQLQKNHGEDMKELLQYTGVAKDDLYKKKAIHNIRQYPGKFLINWMANTSRLLFNYPYSYRKTGPGLIFNMLPHLLTLLIAFPIVNRARKLKVSLPFFLRFALLLVLIYFAASTLLSALIRMFYVVFPVIACTMVYLWQKSHQGRQGILR